MAGGSDRPKYQSPAPCDHAPQEGLLDGVVLDPVKHEWRSIPRPDLEAPILYPVGVWTGQELIVTGQACWAPTAPDACYPGDFPAIAYDPQRNRWSTLPALPPASSPHDTNYALAVGWTGRLAVFQSATEGLVGYDPAARRWSAIADNGHRMDACASANGIVTLNSDGRDGADTVHFEFRSDQNDGKWRASKNFRPTSGWNSLSEWPQPPLHCTETGAVVITYEREAFVFDATKNTVTRRAPPGIHGNWYSQSTDFAPIAPDLGADIELPNDRGLTTALFDAGPRVFQVTNAIGPCTRRPCSTSAHEHVDTYLRHPGG